MRSLDAHAKIIFVEVSAPPRRAHLQQSKEKYSAWNGIIAGKQLYNATAHGPGNYVQYRKRVKSWLSNPRELDV